MLDCGSHPGREGNDSLPFFDSIDDPAKIDLILITHFHIDHCAALPYFTERTNFRGLILMTHATKAVMKLLLSDNIKLQTKASLYTEMELQSCIDKIDVIDYHQSIDYRGIRLTATAAGHVLGAAMFTIEIDGVRVLYTGDYSMEEDRHLIPGSVPPGGPPDVLIVESTFGVTTLPPRLEILLLN
jgi:cleavage and polyadenylation specificity factor subunit 3